MLNKFLTKNIQYNILSLINVFIGFLFIVLLGRKFGAGLETDVYFYSIVVIVYLGHIAHSVWEAMSPYYIELKVDDEIKSYKLYSMLLNNLIIISIFIIMFYFLCTSFFEILSPEKKIFLDVFIFYLLLQNIILINKTILNLEHYYASIYLVDIFLNLTLLLTILFFDDIKIISIAYVTIFSSVLILLFQFYILLFKLNIKWQMLLYDTSLNVIYKNSIKLKVGSLLYGSKDIMIASILTSYGTGFFTLYSYANKFLGVIIQVVNAPIVNIFTTKANYNVAKKQNAIIKNDLKIVLIQTLSLFIFSSLFTYFLLPVLLNYVFGDKFTKEDIDTIVSIFSILVLFFFIWTIQSPYGRLLAIFKMFNEGVKSNILFFIIVFLAYIIFVFIPYNYQYFLFVLIVAQSVQFIYIYIKLKFLVKV